MPLLFRVILGYLLMPFHALYKAIEPMSVGPEIEEKWKSTEYQIEILRIQLENHFDNDSADFICEFYSSVYREAFSEQELLRRVSVLNILFVKGHQSAKGSVFSEIKTIMDHFGSCRPGTKGREFFDDHADDFEDLKVEMYLQRSA